MNNTSSGKSVNRDVVSDPISGSEGTVRNSKGKYTEKLTILVFLEEVNDWMSLSHGKNFPH